MGLLPSGKRVAVKVLKSSKEACKDFTQEVDVMSSLKHENITPLLGICVEDNELISVYDFLSGGNLEENLHGNSKETSVLSWELRFKPAVEIVEALNYLHNECSGPVIHRDVKSSNILLSNEFEPKVVVMTVENLHKCFNPQCICFRCYRIDCCFILLLAIPSTPYDMDDPVFLQLLTTNH
ncbi:probable serine/threonine-protein kinase At1g01540 [Camellia sinensis]|uniref:probable serine/threonine-protein kinase At1g01540 n=1 Tax=Camellia sinensis TaxID=4442 RepID=UPI001036336C|nr:probable serine/threonine-protein kinase At1g01540 [Camellia sinensis]